MRVTLPLGLAVDHNTVIAGCILGIGEKSNFETASRAGVRDELPTELPWELLFHAVKYPIGILGVASASAVVDKDVVRSSLASLAFCLAGTK